MNLNNQDVLHIAQNTRRKKFLGLYLPNDPEERQLEKVTSQQFIDSKTCIWHKQLSPTGTMFSETEWT